MKTRYLIILMLCLCTVSCTKNIMDETEIIRKEILFTAEVEDNSATKTVLQEDRMSVWWSPSDSIRVFYGNNASGLFVSTNKEPVNRTTFRGSIDVVSGSIDDENKELAFYAVYPYSIPSRVNYKDENNSSEYVIIDLPTRQIAADNTFAPGMFPAVAKSENTSLSFYNVCGGIVFTVQDEGIKSVTVKGNNNESIAGEMSVDFLSSGYKLMSPEKEITLIAPDGKTFTPGVRYFISIFPTTFENGFTLTFFKTNSKSDVVFTKPATIKRSRFLVVEDADSNAGEYEYAVPEEAYKDMDNLASVFQTKMTGTSGIYIPLRALFNYGSDDVYHPGVLNRDQIDLSSLNEFSFDSNSSVIKDMYERFNNVINESNKYIRKYQTDFPEIIGQAQVMRAYAHMMMAIGWGTPPLVDHVLGESEYPYNCDNDPEGSMTHEELLVWCAQECESAARILEERDSPQDVQGAYRITKGFAQALAGKAYLFAGEYVKAKELLGAVISSGKYALVSGERFWENFHIEGDGNEEKLYEPNLEYKPELGFAGTMLTSWMESNALLWRTDVFMQNPHDGYTGGIMGWNGLGVPEKFANDFYANDGKDSYRFNTTLIHIDDVVGGSMYGNSYDYMTKEDKLASDEVGIVNGNGLLGQSFWLPFKPLIKSTDANTSSGPGYRYNNFTIMRYAEVLLLYAEACYMTGDNAKALEVINQIQRRAGSQTISTSVDMDVIKKEKQYELWFEGCRWPDLVRWGDTDLVENAGQDIPTLYDKFFVQPVTDETLIWEHGTEETSRFYTKSSDSPSAQKGYVEGKHNRFPYPATALEANPNLVQNPGW